MLSKSLIQFSVDGWSCVPSLLFAWDQIVVEVMKIIVTSFKISHVCTATLSASNTAAGHHQLMPPLETPGHSQTRLSQSLVGSLLLPTGSWCIGFSLCLPRVYFPVLCKFWHLYGGVNGNFLQEGLCHTNVCCTQSSYPCGSLLLTHISTGDAQTQFCLSLCGVPGSWCAQGLFEPSECLWQEWSLILKVNSPRLPSCWGFSDLGCGISAHGHSCEAQMLLLTLDVGYLFMATPAEPLLQRLQPLL